jgi:hypothetical protein
LEDAAEGEIMRAGDAVNMGDQPIMGYLWSKPPIFTHQKDK